MKLSTPAVLSLFKRAKQNGSVKVKSAVYLQKQGYVRKCQNKTSITKMDTIVTPFFVTVDGSREIYPISDVFSLTALMTIKTFLSPPKRDFPRLSKVARDNLKSGVAA